MTEPEFQDHLISDKKVLYIIVAAVLITSLFFLKQSYEFHTLVWSMKCDPEHAQNQPRSTKTARKSIPVRKLDLVDTE